MLSKPKGLLFDKDGTLLDYHATWMPANHAVARTLAGGDTALAERLLEAGGWDRDGDRIRSGTDLAAGDLDDIARLWHPLLPAEGGKDVPAIVAYLDQAFPEHMVPTAVCDLPALLDELAGMALTLGVATADSKNGLLRSLEPFEVLDRFAFAAGFDSGHGRKPEPGMVHGFCRLSGLSEADIWVIGDNSHDIEMARNGGALGIGVLTGTSDEQELTAAGAAVVLPSIADLPGLIRTL